MLRALVDVAKATRTYFLSLRENGFSAEEALQLTIAFQAELIRGARE